MICFNNAPCAVFSGGNFNLLFFKSYAAIIPARNPIADADIVLHGHYHYFSAYESSDRLILQAPTLDSGSEWFENTKGDKSRAGMLTFVIGGKEKWDYIKVIR